MATTQENLDAALVNLDDMSTLADQYIAGYAAIDAERALLKQQILDLIAGGAATEGKAQALFDKSEATENKLRAGLPGVPPVGGTPMVLSYATRAEFDTAEDAYTGDEQITLDGAVVKPAGNGSTISLDYFSHSADGSVSTTGPTD